MHLFDTHCHLDDEQFAGHHGDVVERALLAGIETMVTVGVTAGSSTQCVQLASQYDSVRAAVGIQPNYCGEAQPGDWDRILDLAGEPGTAAIGETGLDRHWDFAPFGIQQDYFDRHLMLAAQRGLPVIVHMRECEAEVLEMLRAARSRGALRGVMHSFSGSAATAEECWQIGLHISFSGAMTYKKSDALRQVAAAVPTDRLLIETDAPYLSPHPQRGQRPNEPALLVHTARCLAEVRGLSLEELARVTTENARRLFAVSRP